jgi:hypothetical protein
MVRDPNLRLHWRLPLLSPCNCSTNSTFNSCYVIHIQRSPSNTPHMMAAHCSQAFRTTGRCTLKQCAAPVFIICKRAAILSKLTPYICSQSTNTVVSRKNCQYKSSIVQYLRCEVFFLLMGFLATLQARFILSPSSLRPQTSKFH